MGNKWLSNEWINEIWDDIDDIKEVKEIIKSSKNLKSLKETYEKIKTEDELYNFTKEFINIYTAETTTKEEKSIMDTFDILIVNRIKDGDKNDEILKEYKENIKSRFEFEKKPNTTIKFGFSVVGSLSKFSSIDDFIKSLENENQEEKLKIDKKIKVDEKIKVDKKTNEPVQTDFN